MNPPRPAALGEQAAEQANVLTILVPTQGKTMPAIAMKKEVEVQAKVLKIYVKCSDRFSAELVDQHDVQIFDQEDGYVPDFMPGEHYGDYIILNIDLDTGKILNWKAPTAEEIEAWVNRDDA